MYLDSIGLYPNVPHDKGLSALRKRLESRKKYISTDSIIRGGSRAAATSKMECFVIIVNNFQPLTIITKRSILDVLTVLDPSLTIDLTEVMLKMHMFTFGKKTLKQKRGTAIGTKFTLVYGRTGRRDHQKI